MNGLDLLPIMLVKLTLIMAAVWIAYLALAKWNPRWQLWTIRVAVCGIVIVLITGVTPPLVRLPVLAALPKIAVDSQVKQTPVVQPQSVSAIPPFVQQRNDALQAPVAAQTYIGQPEPWDLSILENVPWEVVLLCVWAIGVAFGLVRWVCGYARLHRIVERGQAASAATNTIAAPIATSLNIAPPRIVMSDAVATPSVIGIRRPIVLLSSRPGHVLSGWDLQSALAHELAHVAGNDLRWGGTVDLLSLLLWPHPLLWPLSGAHRAACERTSDLTAAELLQDRGGYASSLIKIASSAGKSAQYGMSMARSSKIMSRLKTIASDLTAVRLGRKGKLTAIIATCLMMTVGTTALVAVQQASVDDNPSSIRKMTVTVLRDRDNSPIADASVEFRYYDSNQRKLNNVIATNSEGKAEFEYSSDVAQANLRFLTKHSGQVPYFVAYEMQPVELLPTEKTIRMVDGVQVGGVIIDEAGQPVSGVDVSITAPINDPPSRTLYRLLDVKTGADGRWTLDAAPNPLVGLKLRVRHPQFKEVDLPIKVGTDENYSLERGASVRGFVRDQDGQPIAGAKVSINGQQIIGRATVTDSNGEYELAGLENRPCKLFVMQDGYAPHIFDVKPDETKEATFDFSLLPGKNISFNIVDQNGKPIPKARIALTKWHDLRLFDRQFDADEMGQVNWNGAPIEEAEYDILAMSYRARRGISLSKRDEPYVFKLEPNFAVAGEVVDAQTKQPIPEFEVVLGPPGELLEQKDYVAARNGRFNLTYNEEQPLVYLRVRAPGYKQYASAEMDTSEDAPVFNIALAKEDKPTHDTSSNTVPSNKSSTAAKKITFTVLRDSDSSPIANASVNLQFWSQETKAVNKSLLTDKDGLAVFEYPRTKDKALLRTMTYHSGHVPYNADYDTQPFDLLPTEKTIRMVEGVKVGGIIVDETGQPISDAEVNISVPMTDPLKLGYRYDLIYTKTTADGKWLLDSAPQPVGGLILNVKHPQFMAAGFQVKPSLDAAYQLERGWSVRGVVSDMEGKPIAGAKIVAGNDHFGSTIPTVVSDADGNYCVTGLRRVVTNLTALADGYEPRIATADPSNEFSHDFMLMPGHRIEFHIVDVDGKPIANASAAADTWHDLRTLDWRANSDANGTIVWTGAPADHVAYDFLASGYRSQRHTILEAQEEAHVITLTKEFTINADVVDAVSGEPIEEFDAAFGWGTDSTNLQWSSRESIVGRAGRLNITYAEDQPRVYLRVKSPGYREYLSPQMDTGSPAPTLKIALLKENAVSVVPPITKEAREKYQHFLSYLLMAGDANDQNTLREGLGKSIGGRVRGPLHQNIPNARIVSGHSRFDASFPRTRTDAQGNFVLTNLREPRPLLTVTTDRYAPQISESLQMKGSEFKSEFDLTAGNLIIFRIVDANGQPIPKAFAMANTWRSMQTLDWEDHADADGLIRWYGAPDDAVQYDFAAEGFRPQKNVELAARGEPHTIILASECVVTGNVMDAETGAGIDNFEATLVIDESKGRFDGAQDNRVIGKNGEFNIAYHEASADVYLRITKDGYKPYRSQKLSLDRPVLHHNIRLVRAIELSGIVTKSDGTPVEGAMVYVGNRNMMTIVHPTLRVRDSLFERVTDESGRFELPMTASYNPGVIAIIHDDGYADLTIDQLRQSQSIRLDAWSPLQIEVARDDASKLSLLPIEPSVPVAGHANVVFEAPLVGRGQKIIERFPPRVGLLSVQSQQSLEDQRFLLTSDQFTIISMPGQSRTITIGGRGRTVFGKINFNLPNHIARSWPSICVGEIRFVGSSYHDPRHRSAQFAVAPDGAFRIPDLLPGKYDLSVSSIAPQNSQWHTETNGVLMSPLNSISTPNPDSSSRRHPTTNLGSINNITIEVTADSTNDQDLGTLTGKWVSPKAK